ncbi:DUF934 domain-containing protein [Acidocella sp.]|uniref:DUF934 domain-containing protein n=1 Tax=Acidocella sp. TaxID=50710 RepID=UPI00262B723B|nr:DUF934 domain-containing protein [Acidocella sp.]MDD2794512.1 DUF934 domain-containing protein [Acidocella sp.]
MAIINAQGREVADSWSVSAPGAAPAPYIIIPLAELPSTDSPLPAPLGVQIPPGAALETIAPRLGSFALIAIEFPKFRDGRGFTLARNLRLKYGFKGEIRAVGHVIPDQFAALLHCGFSTLSTSPEHPAAQWRLASSTLENPVHPGQLLSRLMGRGLAA